MGIPAAGGEDGGELLMLHGTRSGAGRKCAQGLPIILVDVRILQKSNKASFLRLRRIAGCYHRGDTNFLMAPLFLPPDCYLLVLVTG